LQYLKNKRILKKFYQIFINEKSKKIKLKKIN